MSVIAEKKRNTSRSYAFDKYYISIERPICNMHFDKYRSTQRQMAKMAKEIVGLADVHKTSSPKKFHIVFVGDCNTPGNSIIKGHRRSPGDAPICRYIKQLPNTIVIRQDEFRTKNCSRCFEELDNVESSKERLKICKKLCKPAENSMPASEVSTYSNKQYIRQQMKKLSTEFPKPNQHERKLRVDLNRLDRRTQSDQFRIEQRQQMKSTNRHLSC